jgi:cobalt/nickel transport system ATP-binding protein
MSEMILQAVNIGYSYDGGAPALGDLSLSVRQGRRLALLGANGSGKTTLLLHLNGTLKPQAGTLMLNGTPAVYDRRGLLAWRQQVGIVFQDPDDQLFAATVRQDISFGPVNLGLADAEVCRRVQDSLEALEITGLAERPTHMLSFGQKKLAAIAGVLAMRPGVIILDEPTAGLDARAAARLLHILGRLHQKGTTLVLATHDIDMAYAWADEVALLHNGKVVRQGSPIEVLRDGEELARCRLRMPWALEIALGFQKWAGVRESAIIPRTQSGLLSYCQQLGRHVACRAPSGAEGAGRGDRNGPAIVLVAFGSTVPDTQRTFSAIEEEVRRNFPDRTVVWAFTSRAVRKHLEAQGKAVPDPQEALDALRMEGCRDVILQSLHVMPGEEFQRLLALDPRGMNISVGAPLLSGPQDLLDVHNILRAICRHDRPNVIAAHGNGKQPHLNEPLLKLAAMMEADNADVALATLDGPPGVKPFARITGQVAGTGAVHFIPLMIVSGIHVRDDLMGDGEESWKQMLAAREVTIAPALGDLPEIRAILVRHIREAHIKG